MFHEVVFGIIQVVIWRQNASGDGRFQKLVALVFVYVAIYETHISID
jgi:hypothetical protein